MKESTCKKVDNDQQPVVEEESVIDHTKSANEENRMMSQDLLVNSEEAEELKVSSLNYASHTLSKRQQCDLELLINGGFYPLTGFLGKEDYESVLDHASLKNGSPWPIPVVLDVSDDFAEKLEIGQELALRDSEGFMPAVMTVEEIWQPDKEKEAEKVYGTTSKSHPGVRYLLEDMGTTYVAGTVKGIQLPNHYDFENLWDTPADMKRLFERMGWRHVVGYHSSNPMHRLHRDLVLSVAKEKGANILLHPAVGETKPGDLHYYARVHCYKAIKNKFPHNMAALSLLPLAMRMAGPREALWHAIVNQNYGCSHFIIGPDHASPPEGNEGKPFYHKYEAQKYAQGFQGKLDIELIPVEETRYVPERKAFVGEKEIQDNGMESTRFKQSDLRHALANNQTIPEWFSYPEVVHELRKIYPPKSKEGFTLFFTGLSGSGKSTIAGLVYAKLIEAGGRPVSLLDGDVVRLNLSSELGFSKAHRDINIRRIGFVASEITKNKGIAICAPIAPYAETRRAVRDVIEQHGSFIEIHVATPLETCEERDRKGLYAKARKGIIPEFTGISDPYDEPVNPEIRIDTSKLTAAEAAQSILLYLLKEGYLDEEE